MQVRQGVDGVTFEQIEASGVDAWLAGLRGELVSKTYRPDPVRCVMIPKPGGGERALGIPSIRCRVIQTAAKIVLEPIFEANFEDSAYGYRPRRSAVDAIKETHWLICRGYTDVVDADLSKYFDTIPHSDLRKSVARRIVDRHVLWLISTAGIVSRLISLRTAGIMSRFSARVIPGKLSVPGGQVGDELFEIHCYVLLHRACTGPRALAGPIR